jgi:hypothetical protein
MNPGGPSPWRNPRILFILFLVFLTGSAAGALAMRYSQKAIASVKPQPSLKENGKEISLQRLKKELNLTTEQAAEIETILDDFMLYFQTLQTQIDDVRANGKERIMQLLNAEQREKFSRMMSELQAKQLR